MGFNLSHLLPRDCPPPSKTPPLSLCLSGSGTVMLILGFILPSKLRGLHYWPQCIYTKIRPPPSLYTLTFPNMWYTDDRVSVCLLSHHGGYNLRLFMNKQKFTIRLRMNFVFVFNNIFSLLSKWTATIGLMGYTLAWQARFALHIHPHWRPVGVWWGFSSVLWEQTGAVTSLQIIIF